MQSDNYPSVLQKIIERHTHGDNKLFDYAQQCYGRLGRGCVRVCFRGSAAAREWLDEPTKHSCDVSYVPLLAAGYTEYVTLVNMIAEYDHTKEVVILAAIDMQAFPVADYPDTAYLATAAILRRNRPAVPQPPPCVVEEIPLPADEA